MHTQLATYIYSTHIDYKFVRGFVKWRISLHLSRMSSHVVYMIGIDQLKIDSELNSRKR